MNAQLYDIKWRLAGLAANLLAVTAVWLLIGPRDAFATTPDAVVPIDWSQYNSSLAASVSPSSPLYKNGQILLNNTRYDYNWIPGSHTFDAASNSYLPKTSISSMEVRIRSGAMAAIGISTVLQTNLYDFNAASLGGITKQQLTTRNAQVIKGLASAHISNTSTNAWGNDWQTALWAAQIGQSAWMSWGDLDASAKTYVTRMVEHEANRFLEPGYQVPFWVVSSGDTKAEENAWNSAVLQLAVAMMPNHVHTNEWRQIGSELMVTAFARPSDMTNQQMVDGKSVAQWINNRGYNANQNGTVINHNRVHPDYMATTSLNMQSYMLQSMAGQTVPQAAGFNGDVIWQAFQQTNFPTPTYNAPGGTIYRNGQAEVYYPQGNDWSTKRQDIFYLGDAFAEVLGQDIGFTDAAAYLSLRADYLLALQARPGGSPGETYRSGDWNSNYVPKEQQVAWQMGDAYLLQWLAAQNAIKPTGNWIPQLFVKNPGFENISLSPGTWTPFSSQPAGPWVVVSGSTTRGGVENYVGVDGPTGIGARFDSSNYNANHKALYLNSQSGAAAPVIGQTLTAGLEPETIYKLSVDIGSRGLAPADAESYLVQLLAGSTVLAEIQEGLAGAPLLVDAQFVNVLLTFNSATLPLDSLLFGQSLQIRFSNPLVNSSSTVAQVLFDNVILNAAPLLPGDFDADGDVDGADFVAWQTHFPTASGATLAMGDADRDGDVDGADFVVWQANFPTSPAGATSPVPEPSGAIIVLLAAGCVGFGSLRIFSSPGS
jgi:hypothetical protein